MDINLKTLIGKLNDSTRAAATRAANICVGLGQYEVDIEHLFLALLEQPACDLVVAARACEISVGALESDLRQEVARLDDTRAAFEDRMAGAILTQQPPNALAEWLGREEETDNGT